MAYGLKLLAVLGVGVVLALLSAGAPGREEEEVMRPKELPERLRGANGRIDALDEAVIRRMAQWKCNAVRTQFSPDERHRRGDSGPPPGPAPTAADPLLPYRENVEHLERILPLLRRHGLRIIVGLNMYGRHVEDFWEPEKGRKWRDHLPEFWAAFAERFRGEPAILGYDIFNEPNYQPGQEGSWYEDMLPRAMRAIRAVDRDVWLVVEPGPWGLPAGFEDMEPVDDPRVIYSFHHYAPHNYTHQGVHAHRAHTRGKLTYPGQLRMFDSSPKKHWDKEPLRESMWPAIEFMNRHDARMLVGEFSVIRWAPGRAQWLRDSIEVFEEEGMDWLFHSVAGWNGWNPTFGPDDPSAQNNYGGKTTDRLEVLLEGWALNAE